MDQNLNTKRLHVAEIGFNTSRMTFLFGNAIALAINSFAHLNSKSQLALAAFVVMLNIASFLSFDTELKQFAALTADAAGEKSEYVKMGKKVPYTAFRLFCFVISVVAIVTQLRAIYV